MKQNVLLLSALLLSGILGLSVAPVQAQDKSDDGSGSKVSKSGQREQGGKMKSRDSGSAAMQGSRSTNQGQWSKEDIKKVQEALKDKGSDPGPADGFMGPQTQKAIREFQQTNGLKSTGRLNAETTKALGVEGGSTSGAESSSMDQGTPSDNSVKSPMGRAPESKSNK